MTPTRFSILAAMWMLGLAGCASPDAGLPAGRLTSEHYEWPADVPRRDKTLLVFLPGRGTTGKTFKEQNFLSAIDHSDPNVEEWRGCFYRGPAADAVLVDLTFPYYMNQTAVTRLHEDIIRPARTRGYRRIWLAGCSMGGLGAILYAHEHPGEIDGIVAIAPYLGDKSVVGEIEAAGGLANWQPKAPLADDDFQRRLWLAIKAERFDQPGRVPLVLGYGTGDRFVYGHRLLAAQLPPDHVFRVFGFHNWATWHQLWKMILASPFSPLAPPPGSVTMT